MLVEGCGFMESMLNIEIKITGPGLVVNAPAAIIQEALENYGYTVKLSDFDGKDQGEPAETWPTQTLVMAHLHANDRHNVEARIEVKPLPWGG